ncbi:MAG: DUF3048 domain-containing protein, partial [Candidatus Saccharimonadales bacterium]
MIDDVKPVNGPSESLEVEPGESDDTNSLNSPNDNVETLDMNKLEHEPSTEDTPPAPPKNNWKDKLRAHWPPSRKEWVFIVIVILLAAGLAYFLIRPAAHKSDMPLKPKAVKQATAISNLVPSTLTGLPVDPSVNQRTVTGVMIENSLPARPQSGLGQAGVVFEALTEGGISRFLALYQDTAPSNIGPIRSARPYFIQWALGFDAAYAHVGGSPQALADISAWDVHDMNEFYNGAYYHRSGSRAAPHNMYTSIAQLNKLEAAKGFTSTFTGFPRKSESPAKQAAAGNINFNISWSSYAVHYDYVKASNSYNRSEGGTPHVDANTNTQISPKVVIAMVVPYSVGSLDATGASYSDYAAVGSGPVYVFQDGTVTTGQWAKTSAQSQITFTSGSGQTIK